MGETGAPVVSIGIPTFNRRAYLERALETALNQTYAKIQVVISDNASTDDTRAYLDTLSDPRVLIVRQEVNTGMTANFNAVLDAATGDYFLLLSDDDLLAPDAIERLIAPFLEITSADENPEVGLSWCPCMIIDAEGKQLWQTAGGPSTESPVSLIEALWLGHRGPRLSSVLVRTKDARAVGGYDQQRFGLICDTANWAQVALCYAAVACIATPLVQYRVHPSSATGGSVCAQWQEWGRNMHEDLLKIVRSRFPSDVKRFERLRDPLLANLTTDVLMRGKGTQGWIGRSLREVWRSRRYLLTPYVFRRAVVDGVKLFRSK